LSPSFTFLWNLLAPGFSGLGLTFLVIDLMRLVQIHDREHHKQVSL